MESEKVKEIKKVFSTWKMTFHGITNTDILTLINELESENEKLKQHKRELEGGQRDLLKVIKEFDKETQQLKDRISELENTIKNNLQYSKGYGEGVKATVEVAYPKKLNEFIEKVAKRLINITGIKQILDEVLKEFIKE